MRLNDQRQRIANQQSKNDLLEDRVIEFENLLAKTALVNQALFELLQKKLDISPEDLRRQIREIDLRDGKEDQRLQLKPLICPKCRAKSTAGALKCWSCGATMAPDYPYEL